MVNIHCPLFGEGDIIIKFDKAKFERTFWGSGISVLGKRVRDLFI